MDHDLLRRALVYREYAVVLELWEAHDGFFWWNSECVHLIIKHKEWYSLPRGKWNHTSCAHAQRVGNMLAPPEAIPPYAVGTSALLAYMWKLASHCCGESQRNVVDVPWSQLVDDPPNGRPHRPRARYAGGIRGETALQRLQPRFHARISILRTKLPRGRGVPTLVGSDACVWRFARPNRLRRPQRNGRRDVLDAKR